MSQISITNALCSYRLGLECRNHPEDHQAKEMKQTEENERVFPQRSVLVLAFQSNTILVLTFTVIEAVSQVYRQCL